MSRKKRRSRMQVEIVDPTEVSSVIELEPSARSINTGAQPSVAAANDGTRSESPPEGRREVRVRHDESTDPRRSAYGPDTARPPVPKSAGRSSGSPPKTSKRSTPPALPGSVTAGSAGASPRLPAGTVTSPVLAVSSGSAPVLNERLIARKMAVSVHAAIQESGCRRILLTSPTKLSGKSHFFRAVAPELQVIAQDQYRFLRTSDLEEIAPPLADDPQIAIVDGPSMFDGSGLLALPQDWMASFDGAIVLVMGRRTESEALKEAVKWMSDSRIKTIGLVWNDFVNPPPALRFRLWRRYMRQGTMLRDLLSMIRTGGRSLKRLP